jgi:hypothetical protein
MTVQTDTFQVIYRTGGTHFCEWRLVYTMFVSHSDAIAKASEIERMGYKTLVRSSKELASVGLPVGWDAEGVDWESDKIEVSPYVTRWMACNASRGIV